MEEIRLIGPDTTKDVIHYVYPNGKKMTSEQLNPHVGGWYKKCKHVYEYVNAEVCPFCGRDTHEPDWQKINAENQQWLKDNPEAWRSVGWWSI